MSKAWEDPNRVRRPPFAANEPLLWALESRYGERPDRFDMAAQRDADISWLISIVADLHERLSINEPPNPEDE